MNEGRPLRPDEIHDYRDKLRDPRVFNAINAELAICSDSSDGRRISFRAIRQRLLLEGCNQINPQIVHDMIMSYRISGWDIEFFSEDESNTVYVFKPHKLNTTQDPFFVNMPQERQHPVAM